MLFMRDRWIPDSSKFHKPIDEDSANEDALFVRGIFFMGIKNGELFMEETKKRSMGDPHMAVRRIGFWRYEREGGSSKVDDSRKHPLRKIAYKTYL